MSLQDFIATRFLLLLRFGDVCSVCPCKIFQRHIVIALPFCVSAKFRTNIDGVAAVGSGFVAAGLAPHGIFGGTVAIADVDRAP